LIDGPSPFNTPAPRKRRTGLIIGLLAFAVVAVGVIWTVAIPKGRDKIDSGIQACKMVSEGKSPDGKPTDGPSSEPGAEDEFTQEQYKDLRDIFADSRHDDIKAAGTKFVDVAYQASGAGDGALAFLMPMMTSYTELSSACANHGYPLPALSGL
jgi:hypothetical protein